MVKPHQSIIANHVTKISMLDVDGSNSKPIKEEDEDDIDEVLSMRPEKLDILQLTTF